LFSREVSVIADSSAAPESRPAAANRPRAYLEDFLNEVRGRLDLCGLTSGDCLRASRLALEAQARADEEH
jgi:hypothetical protein